ncbi:MAG: sugar ABC transporter permease [Chloroflexota bacterium]|nr:MAG: sugar ABC transporter permease [Chloroflexota bacterium]
MTISLTQEQRLLLLRNTTPILFVIIFLFFGLQSPRFLELESISNTVKQASFVGIAAVGMTFVLLTGGIDLSVGATMYLAPLIAGTLMRDHDLPVLPALLVALGMGFVIGLVNGFFIVKLKIVPFIVTLSTLFFMRGAGTYLTDSRQLDFPRSMVDFGLTRIIGVPLPIIAFGVVVLIGHIVLTRTAYGRQLFAVGNDPEAAKKAGIPTDTIIWAVYIINGVLAALAGFILIAQIGRLDQAFGEGMEFDVVAAAVLGGASLFGGVGRAYGPVIGAVLIQMVRTGLIYTNVNLYLQPIAVAGIIFLAAFFDSLRDTNIRKLKRRFIRVEV